jgi:hypothetical protein
MKEDELLEPWMIGPGNEDKQRQRPPRRDPRSILG